MADNNNTSEEDADSGCIMTSENADGPGSSSSPLPSPWEAAADGGTSANSTTATGETWLPGGLENVDEDAAPVPLIEQIAEMELNEKDDVTSLRGPSERENIDDESKVEIDFGTESNDEYDGPSLPLTFQRDSLADVEEKQVVAPQISASSPREATTVTQSPGDEENLQQRVAVPENNTASDNEDVDQVLVLPTAAAAERNPSNPSLHILEAWMVEEEEEEEEEDYNAFPQAAVATVPVPAVTPGGNDTVYEATLVEPWWKQRRVKVFLVLIFALITALTAGLGVLLSSSPGAGAGAGAGAVEITAPPSVAIEIIATPSMTLTPSQSPSVRNDAMRGSLFPTALGFEITAPPLMSVSPSQYPSVGESTELMIGDQVCMTGFIMDTFCIELGTLLAHPAVTTLKNPELHSYHCLLDVDVCIDSGYQVLGNKDPISGLYCPGLRIDIDETDRVLAAGRAHGTTESDPNFFSCDSCTGPDGNPIAGYRATIVGTVKELGDGMGRVTGVPGTRSVAGTPVLTNVQVLDSMVLCDQNTMVSVEADVLGNECLIRSVPGRWQ